MTAQASISEWMDFCRAHANQFHCFMNRKMSPADCFKNCLLFLQRESSKPSKGGCESCNFLRNSFHPFTVFFQIMVNELPCSVKDKFKLFLVTNKIYTKNESQHNKILISVFIFSNQSKVK